MNAKNALAILLLAALGWFIIAFAKSEPARQERVQNFTRDIDNQAIAQKSIDRLPLDMRGVVIRITDYEDDNSLHRIGGLPDLTLSDFRRINQLTAKAIQKRGGSVEYVRINGDGYFAWLKQNNRTNSIDNIGAYVEWLGDPTAGAIQKTAAISVK